MQAKLPQFDIDLSSFLPQLDSLLSSNLNKIDELLTQPSFDWDNLMRPLEDMEDNFERLWSPLSHLHAVINSPKLREVYQGALPKLSAYEAAIGHNQALYKAIQSIPQANLDATQQKIITDALRNFQLAGVGLAAEKKEQFETIQARLAELSNQFENNLLDAVLAFSLNILEETRLTGMPPHAIQTAKELAESKGLKGWLLTLDFPCYSAVSTYCDDRDLRETLYKAFVTRASDEGPNGGQFDNTPIIDEILALRHEKAHLLGFDNYATLSLATKMARTPAEVMEFLLNLAERAKPAAQREFQALKDWVLSEYQLDSLQPWDMAYYAEKLQQQRFDISQEALRPYFPEQHVLRGLFTIINRLYGVNFVNVSLESTWHPDVLCYAVVDQSEQTRGYIYIDLYARAHKRGGAWMDALQSRRVVADSVQLPIATLTCNFAKTGDNATLSHDEVLTLFHEFGHCLHHLLTRVDYNSASGIHGVEWDAVELPSQIFENWCWEEEALALISSHVETGETLPKALFDKLVAAKNFNTALATMRQVEFSLFDFRIHLDYEPGAQFFARMLDEVRLETAVAPAMPYNRFAQSFSHIFAGGYCAGYYSYKWAEVLSSDAFSRFEEEGIFNPKTGQDFLTCILEVGSAKPAAEAFIDFRGRPATIDALLRHNGLMS